MQLPLAPDELVPLGIGAIVAVAAVAALVLGLRKRSDESPAPTEADWTGENLLVAEPVERHESPVRRTVADAIAARRADTDPFPVVPSSVAVIDRVGGTGDLELEPLDVAYRDESPTPPSGMHSVLAAPRIPAAAEPSPPASPPAVPGPPTVAGLPAAESPSGAASPSGISGPPAPTVTGPPTVWGPPASAPDTPSAMPAAAAWFAAAHSADTVPGLPAVASPQASGAAAGPSADPAPADRAADAESAETAIPHQSSMATGSSRNVGAAVAHVLAARANAPSPGTDRRGDARDRLLAALLDDPRGAVGAAVDLQDCQERMDRLAGALNDERGRLRDVMGRLARSGLRPDQLARLSGLSDDDVSDLLRRNIH